MSGVVSSFCTPSLSVLYVMSVFSLETRRCIAAAVTETKGRGVTWREIQRFFCGCWISFILYPCVYTVCWQPPALPEGALGVLPGAIAATKLCSTPRPCCRWRVGKGFPRTHGHGTVLLQSTPKPLLWVLSMIGSWHDCSPDTFVIWQFINYQVNLYLCKRVKLFFFCISVPSSVSRYSSFLFLV